MERICVKCGELTQGDVTVCSHCSAELDAPMLVDGTPRAETAVGTQMQTGVVLAYVLSLFNLTLGPASVFVTIFNSMLPSKLFDVIPYMLVYVHTMLLPIVALFCAVLSAIARRRYNPLKHAFKNIRAASLSYKFSVCAVLFWLILVGAGLGVIFYP